MDDSDIIPVIKQCLNGHKESFNQIVLRYQKKIYKLCLHFTGSPQEAEDAAMEIFFKIFKSLNTFDINQKFSTWIFQIAINHLRDLSQKKKRERESFLFSFDFRAVNLYDLV